MTTKTPEQIAEQVIIDDYQLEDATTGLPLSWDETLEAVMDAHDFGTPGDILSLIVHAIEADRRQRRELAEAREVLARYDRDPSNANLHDAVGALRNIVEGKA